MVAPVPPPSDPAAAEVLLTDPAAAGGTDGPAGVRAAATASAAPARSSSATGLIYAVAAYGLWGGLPVYFIFLAPAGGIEIVSWRILLSLAFCALLVLVTRSWRSVVAVVRDRRTTLLLGAASVLIAVNWVTYVLAALNGQVVQAALGYFLTPIVTVLLGVLVLRERLRPAQWISIGITVVAALVLAFGDGQVPWIALTLAFSFGGYGLLKNRVGGRVDAVTGLTLESAWLSPVALVALVLIGVAAFAHGPDALRAAFGGGVTIGAAGPAHLVLLLCAGVITAVPLLFFAAAARRLPLTLIGLTQYIAPIMQLIIGVAVLAEPMSTERWIGFALVWLALIVLSADALLATRKRSRVLVPRPA